MIVFVSSEHFSWDDNQRSRGANRDVPGSERAGVGVEGRVARKLETWDRVAGANEPLGGATRGSGRGYGAVRFHAGVCQVPVKSIHSIRTPKIAISAVVIAAARAPLPSVFTTRFAACQYNQAPTKTNASSMLEDTAGYRHNPKPSRGRLPKLPGRIGRSAR